MAGSQPYCPLLRLEPQLLVGRRARHVRNEPDGRLGNAGAVAGDIGQLEEWRVHHLLVDELLGLVKHHEPVRATPANRLGEGAIGRRARAEGPGLDVGAGNSASGPCVRANSIALAALVGVSNGPEIRQ